MELHQTTGRTRLGLTLATTTMLSWATLPVALSVLLRELEPETLTWFRFALASVLLATILWARGSLPQLRSLGTVHWVLLAVATLGLASNYVLFLMGLSMTTPANTQILTQLSPLLLALGGMLIFGERFNRRQWIGFGVLLAGLAVFCFDQLQALVVDGSQYLLGCAVLILASLVWTAYGLAQKQLLATLPSPALQLCIYAGCALCLAPLSRPAQLGALSLWEAALLVYCALNTVVAYGAFSAALAHVEASRVGAILSLTPVATFSFIQLTHSLYPGALAPEHFSPSMLFGAGVVVVGSVVTSRG